MTVLVTGGAGYIGAHVVAALLDAGERVLVIDDLSDGDISRLPRQVPLERIDLADHSQVGAIAESLSSYGVCEIVHLAAKKQVAESVTRPEWYVTQNLGGLANLYAAAQSLPIKRVVFSSSASVYGHTELPAVDETCETRPANPYGRTKLAGEWLTADVAEAHGFAAASLRYFNVAGAASAQLVDRGTHNLIPMVFARVSSGEPPQIFGDDYDTPDGTCVRDFIHVVDLAAAHVATLHALRSRASASHTIYNVGTGVGTSVADVIDVVAKTTGIPLEPVVLPRRVGDPAQVVADANRIQAELGWRATLSVEAMVSSAWNGWSARSQVN